MKQTEASVRRTTGRLDLGKLMITALKIGTFQQKMVDIGDLYSS